MGHVSVLCVLLTVIDRIVPTHNKHTHTSALSPAIRNENCKITFANLVGRLVHFHLTAFLLAIFFPAPFPSSLLVLLCSVNGFKAPNIVAAALLRQINPIKTSAPTIR